ncbi:MAG: NADP-dependent oxidoreductase [Spirochaetaceae bacterium]|nr:MAG: NADP-dependent oxidoreductase [Spirochaetaceae bacterium]
MNRPEKGREIHLRRNPTGTPVEDDFEVVVVPVIKPADGEVLVRTRFFSVDPYMRGRISAARGYADPWPPGEAMRGGCVGEVIESGDPALPVGAFVLGGYGWREYYRARADEVNRIEPGETPLSAYLGVLGMPGMTAYVGLLTIGGLERGESVFVSGAAGAVGSTVCQIARLHDCRVVGSAGSERKVEWLTERARIDAFNYKKNTDLTAELKSRFPDGIDVYFDNVGGAHLEAAIANMNRHGRIVACGMISTYNTTEPPPGPRNMMRIVGERLTIRGFIVGDHAEQRERFTERMTSWIESGDVVYEETVVDGIENAPRAFIGLFSGENLGKMVVKV